MAETFVVSHVEYTSASSMEQRTGLLGFVQFRLGKGLEIDGVTLRRTRAGKITLSYPRRGSNKAHFAVRPRDEETRQHIEHQVLSALDLDGGGDR